MSGYRWNNRFNPPLQTAVPTFPRRAVETPQTPANHTTHQMVGAPPPNIYTNQITQIPDLSMSIVSSNTIELSVTLNVSFAYMMTGNDHFDFTFTASGSSTSTTKRYSQRGDGLYTIDQFDPGVYYSVYVTPVINGNNTTSSPAQEFLSSSEIAPGRIHGVYMSGSDTYAIATIPFLSPPYPRATYFAVNDDQGDQQKLVVPTFNSSGQYTFKFGPYIPQTVYNFTFQAVTAGAGGIYRYSDPCNIASPYSNQALTTRFIPGPPAPPYFTSGLATNTTVTIGVSLQAGTYPTPDFYTVTTYTSTPTYLGSVQGAVQISGGFSVPTSLLPPIQGVSNLVADLTDTSGNWYSFYVVSSNTGGVTSTFTNPYYTAPVLGPVLVAGFTSVTLVTPPITTSNYTNLPIPQFTVGSLNYSTLKLETFANSEYTFQPNYLSLWTGKPANIGLSGIAGSGTVTITAVPGVGPRPTSYVFNGNGGTYNSSLAVYTISGLTNGVTYTFSGYAIANGVSSQTASSFTTSPKVQSPISLSVTSIADTSLNFQIQRPLGGAQLGYQIFAYGTGAYTVSTAVADSLSAFIPGSITLSATYNPYTLAVASVETVSPVTLTSFVYATLSHYVGPPSAPVLSGSYIGNSPNVFGQAPWSTTLTTNVSLTLSAANTGVTVSYYILSDLSGNNYPSFSRTCTISQAPYISRTFSITPFGNGVTGVSAQISFNFNPQPPTGPPTPYLYFDGTNGCNLHMNWTGPTYTGNDFYLLSNVFTGAPTSFTSNVTSYNLNNVTGGGKYQYRIYANICGILSSNYALTNYDTQGQPGNPGVSYTLSPTGINFSISEDPVNNGVAVDQFVITEYYSNTSTSTLYTVSSYRYNFATPRTDASLQVTLSGIVTTASTHLLQPNIAQYNLSERWTYDTGLSTPNFTVVYTGPVTDAVLLNTYSNIVTLTISQGATSYSFPVTSITDAGGNTYTYANPLVTLPVSFNTSSPATFTWTSGYGPFLGGTYVYNISANRNGTNGQSAVWNIDRVSTGVINFYVGSPGTPTVTINNLSGTVSFAIPSSAANVVGYSYTATDNYGRSSISGGSPIIFGNLNDGSGYSYTVTASWYGLTSVPSLNSTPLQYAGFPASPIITPSYFGTVATISTSMPSFSFKPVPAVDICLNVTGGTYNFATQNISASYLPGCNGPTFIVNVSAGITYTFSVSAYANSVYSRITSSVSESFTSLQPTQISGKPVGTYDIVTFSNTTASVTICTALPYGNGQQHILPDTYYATAEQFNWSQTSAKNPQNQSWYSIASSSDGTYLAAVVYNGRVWTSTNAGVSWTEQVNAPGLQWYSIASSSDGTYLVAVALAGGIYTSANRGVSWTQRNTAQSSLNWISVTSSADGKKLVAVAYGGGIWRSTDSGVTWSQTSAPSSSSDNWFSVTSSSDGKKLAAVFANDGGGIWTSSNYGVTWTQTNAPVSTGWHLITSSTDGTQLIAVMGGGGIWRSIDSGVTWNKTSAPSSSSENWYSVASSDDGTKLAAGMYGGGGIWRSTDSGVTWIQTNAPSSSSDNWQALTSSADGTKLAAVLPGTGIYTGSPIVIAASSIPSSATAQSYTFTFPGLTAYSNYKFSGYTTTLGLSTGSQWSDSNTYNAGGPYPIQGITFGVTPTPITTATVTLSVTVNIGSGSFFNNPSTLITSASYYISISDANGNTVSTESPLTTPTVSYTVSSGNVYTAYVYATRNMSTGATISGSFGIVPAAPSNPTISIVPITTPSLDIANGDPVSVNLNWGSSPTTGVTYQWSTGGAYSSTPANFVLPSTVLYGASYNLSVYSLINGLSSSTVVSASALYVYTNPPKDVGYTRNSTTINISWATAWQPGIPQTITYNISYLSTTPTGGTGMSSDNQNVRIGINSISAAYYNTFRTKPETPLLMTLSGLDVNYSVQNLAFTNVTNPGAYYTFTLPSPSLATFNGSNMAVTITNPSAFPTGGYTVRNLSGGTTISSGIYSNNYTFTGVLNSNYNIGVQSLNNGLYSLSRSAVTGYFSLSTIPVTNFRVTYYATTISMTWTIPRQLDGVTGGTNYTQTLNEQTLGQLTAPPINNDSTTYTFSPGTLGNTYNFYIVDSYYGVTGTASANQISLFTTPASNVAQIPTGSTITVNWSSATQTVYNSGPGTTNPSTVLPNGGYRIQDLCNNYNGGNPISVGSSATTCNFTGLSLQKYYNFAVTSIHNGILSAAADGGALYLGAQSVLGLSASLCGLVVTLSWTNPSTVVPTYYTITNTNGAQFGNPNTPAVRGVTCNVPGTYAFTTLKSERINLVAAGAGGGFGLAGGGGAGGLASISLNVQANTTVICTVSSGGLNKKGLDTTPAFGGGNSTIYVPGFQILDAGGGGGGGFYNTPAGVSVPGTNGGGFNADGGAGGYPSGFSGSGSGPPGSIITPGGGSPGSILVMGSPAPDYALAGYVSLSLTTQALTSSLQVTAGSIGTTQSISFSVLWNTTYNFNINSTIAGNTANSTIVVSTNIPTVSPLATTFLETALSNTWTNVAAQTYLLTNLVTGSYFVLASSGLTGSGTVGTYYNFSIYSLSNGIPSPTGTTSTAIQIYSPPPRNFAVTNSNTTLIITGNGTAQIQPPTYDTETFALRGSDTAGNQFSGTASQSDQLSFTAQLSSPGATVNLSSWGIYCNLSSVVVTASCVLTVPSTTLQNAVTFTAGQVGNTSFQASVTQGTPSADQIVFTPSLITSSCNIVSITPQSNIAWTAMSSDGSVIVFNSFNTNASNVWVSINSGANWTPVSIPTVRPTRVAVSSNGTTGIITTETVIYQNTALKTGGSWTVAPGTQNATGMYGLCMSPDGSKIVVGQNPGRLYTASSPNYNTFTTTPTPTNNYWRGLAWSSDGSTVVATATNDTNVYYSTTNGTSWSSQNVGILNFHDQLAINSNGTRLLIGTTDTTGASDGYMYLLSGNPGSWTVTRTISSVVGQWRAAAMTPDGNTMVAGQWNNTNQVNSLYITYDGGSNWQVDSRFGASVPVSGGNVWCSAALSSNGLVQSVANFSSSNQNLLVLTNSISPVTSSTITGSTAISPITGTVNAGSVYTVTPLLRYLPGPSQKVWANPLPPAFVPEKTGGGGSIGFGPPLASGWFPYQGKIFAGIMIQTTVSVAQGFGTNLANYYNITYSGPYPARSKLEPYWVQNGCAYWQLENTTAGYDLVPGTYITTASYIYRGIASISSSLQFNVPFQTPVLSYAYANTTATRVTITLTPPSTFDPNVSYTTSIYSNGILQGSSPSTITIAGGQTVTIGGTITVNGFTSQTATNSVTNASTTTSVTPGATSNISGPIVVTAFTLIGGGGGGGSGKDHSGGGGASGSAISWTGSFVVDPGDALVSGCGRRGISATGTQFGLAYQGEGGGASYFYLNNTVWGANSYWAATGGGGGGGSEPGAGILNDPGGTNTHNGGVTSAPWYALLFPGPTWRYYAASVPASIGGRNYGSTGDGAEGGGQAEVTNLTMSPVIYTGATRTYGNPGGNGVGGKGGDGGGSGGGAGGNGLPGTNASSSGSGGGGGGTTGGPNPNGGGVGYDGTASFTYFRLIVT